MAEESMDRMSIIRSLKKDIEPTITPSTERSLDMVVDMKALFASPVEPGSSMGQVIPVKAVIPESTIRQEINSPLEHIDISPSNSPSIDTLHNIDHISPAVKDDDKGSEEVSMEYFPTNNSSIQIRKRHEDVTFEGKKFEKPKYELVRDGNVIPLSELPGQAGLVVRFDNEHLGDAFGASLDLVVDKNNPNIGIEINLDGKSIDLAKTDQGLVAGLYNNGISSWQGRGLVYSRDPNKVTKRIIVESNDPATEIEDYERTDALTIRLAGQVVTPNDGILMQHLPAHELMFSNTMLIGQIDPMSSKNVERVFFVDSPVEYQSLEGLSYGKKSVTISRTSNVVPADELFRGTIKEGLQCGTLVLDNLGKLPDSFTDLLDNDVNNPIILRLMNSSIANPQLVRTANVSQIIFEDWYGLVPGNQLQEVFEATSNNNFVQQVVLRVPTRDGRMPLDEAFKAFTKRSIVIQLDDPNIQDKDPQAYIEGLFPDYTATGAREVDFTGALVLPSRETALAYAQKYQFLHRRSEGGELSYIILYKDTTAQPPIYKKFTNGPGGWEDVPRLELAVIRDQSDRRRYERQDVNQQVFSVNSVPTVNTYEEIDLPEKTLDKLFDDFEIVNSDVKREVQNAVYAIAASSEQFKSSPNREQRVNEAAQTLLAFWSIRNLQGKMDKKDLEAAIQTVPTIKEEKNEIESLRATRPYGVMGDVVNRAINIYFGSSDNKNTFDTAINVPSVKPAAINAQ